MACYSPSPPATTSSSSSSSSWYSSPKRTLLIYNSNNKPISYYTRKKRKRIKTLVISSLTEERVSSPYNPIVFQASRLLGPPARFEASKLKVVLKGEEKGYQQHAGTIIPRTYTLSHCDFTAKLTLAISNVINIDQLKGWYNRDDVVAEWKKVKEEMCLHVHCYVSGGPNVLLDLAAEFRYHIFTKELPLVLKAVLHGDSMFFKEHPELMEAMVLVYFHSSSNKYNRVECWGALKKAAQGCHGGGSMNRGVFTASKIVRLPVLKHELESLSTALRHTSDHLGSLQVAAPVTPEVAEHAHAVLTGCVARWIILEHGHQLKIKMDQLQSRYMTI